MLTAVHTHTVVSSTRLSYDPQTASKRDNSILTMVSVMTIIATRNLRREHVPQGSFNWSTFSTFALTFNPLYEAADEGSQKPASATPSDTWSAVALRYFLYCWQRIGNNQGVLRPEAIDKVQIAMNILRSKL